MLDDVQFDNEADEEDLERQLEPGTVAAVVHGTDWTTETIVSQLRRKNIHLNPRFQRRDAWKRDRKSRFIESLIVGLPIPQIVLAESKTDRGKFIVLDGKQRLLAILQFWGVGEGENNAYTLSGLTLRGDLKKKSFVDLSTDPELEGDYNALCNQPIRTIVIRNWISSTFLHTVFLRLNTGSVNLSPQELRQALHPGPFSDWVDDAAAESKALQSLLGLAGPDPRMRDIEILARFLAFRFFATSYQGRMKRFLDDSFGKFNDAWKKYEPDVEKAKKDFEDGVNDLLRIFKDRVARKPESPQFNRAIFDALIFYQSQDRVRRSVRGKTTQTRAAYERLFKPGSAFLNAIESDTAGVPHTSSRLKIWGQALSRISGRRFSPPAIQAASAAKNARRKPKRKGRTR